MCDRCDGKLTRDTTATSHCEGCGLRFYVDSATGKPIRRIILPNTWGADITTGDLKVGDEFAVPGTPRMGRFSGKIAKVNRVNITYDTVYAVGPTERPMTLKASKGDFVGGNVLRNGFVHKIK